MEYLLAKTIRDKKRPLVPYPHIIHLAITYEGV